MCFVSVPNIIKYGKDCEIELFPSQLATRFCAHLSITNYKLEWAIADWSDIVYSQSLLGSPPQSAIALSIYVFTQKGERPAHSINSINKISNICGISSTCLRRLIGLYKQGKVHFDTTSLRKFKEPNAFYYK